MIDINKYIEIPFKPQGRDFSGCDCYGLIYLFYKTEYNKELPLLTNSYDNPHEHKRIQDLITLEMPILNVVEIENPYEGCVVLFKFVGYTCHMGIYIGKNKILHVMNKSNSVCEKIDSIRLRGRLEGFYEFK